MYRYLYTGFLLGQNVRMETDNLLETVKAKVVCSQCGGELERTVGWLKSHDSFDCPVCGEITDLTTAEWKARVQGYIDACTGFGK